MNNVIQKHKAAERIERINNCGGFGMKRTQVIKDKTKYSRKQKHPNGCRGAF